MLGEQDAETDKQIDKKRKKDAFSQIRTDDLLITSEVPYQLGHKGFALITCTPRIPTSVCSCSVLTLANQRRAGPTTHITGETDYFGW